MRTSNRSGVGSSGRAPRNQPATWIETAVAPVGAEASMEMAPKVPGCHLVVRGHRVVGCPCLPSRGRLVVEGLPHGGVLDGNALNGGADHVGHHRITDRMLQVDQ